MTTAGIAPPSRPALQLPDPGHFWVRVSPRPWPGPSRWWVHLATAGVGGLGKPVRAALPELPARPWDDVVYVPPVNGGQVAERDALVRGLLAAGTPVLVQLLPGDDRPPAGAVVVYDLLEALLTGDLDRLALLPAGSAAVWPLVAGLTDERKLWRRAGERLAGAGVAIVQAQALDLAPAERRALSQRAGGRGFAELFHAAPPAERDFAIVAHGLGLAPFLDRPLPAPPLLGALNRRLGGLLGLTAELWLRVGRPVSRGQAFYRAMRWLDRSRRDLQALARDGNLGVLTWLDAESRRLVEEVLATGSSPLLDELLAEYVGARAVNR